MCSSINAIVYLSIYLSLFSLPTQFDHFNWAHCIGIQAVLYQYLSSDDLCAPNEEIVFQTVCAWCEAGKGIKDEICSYDSATNGKELPACDLMRKECFPRLWKCVRLPLLSVAFLRVILLAIWMEEKCL